MKHVALLRGINVGGKNMLPMKELAGYFVKAGCRDVATYIQSGNVVFSAQATVLKKLPGVISAMIAEGFGHRVPVVVRSHEELASVVSNNPFPPPREGEKLLYVAFLADLPAADAIAGLDPDRSPPDRFVVLGREVYMHLINHAAKTKLTNAWMDSKLSTVSTSRNWATVLKLHEMTQD
jgi:uncharacterized protein (DUF1697 family)